MAEKHIEHQICFFLEGHGVSIDKIISEGYFNGSKGIYQKRTSPYAKPGHSDLSGVIPPLGRALYIEVKQPDEMRLADRPSSIQEKEYLDALYHKKIKKSSLEKYKHRLDQSKFIEEKIQAGAVAFFASSVEEVIKKLKDFGVSIS